MEMDRIRSRKPGALGRWFGVFLTLSVLAPPVHAACAAGSGPSLVPLVELFTSEGCDSCPAADRWLSSQFPSSGAAREASALAFHVDYWDRLGWVDRFASPQYTQRQHDIGRANRSTFVYTPQVVVQGRDTPGWSRGGVAATLAAARRQPGRADIALEAKAGADGMLNVQAKATVSAATLRSGAALWIAYTDSGLVSQVAAGENRGVRLTHDHVVRRLEGPFALDADGVARVALAWTRPKERGRDAALVAFVQNSRNADVLQTLTLAGCDAL